MRAGLLASAATLCLGGLAGAQTLPTGGSVAHGDVNIAQPGANTMTITQGTNSAIVNWQSFDIGSGAHVDIRQPGQTASMLNRVTGSTTSDIHGRLTANGQVHLVNPNGIFIGPGGTVDAGAFVASTLDISNEDFVAGRLRYSGLGNSATVENAGRVSIGRGGYAALLGGRVKNSGVVTVPMGRIAFGSGERAVLDVSGDQFLQVAVPTGGEDGDEALIENSGLASAQGGLIEMRAATAREAVRQAVNLSGVAEARSVSMRNGAIVLGGGGGGTVNVTGRVSTRSAPSALLVDESPRPPKAPEITVTGHRIRLAGAEIDASGDGAGGLVRIGGDFAGAGNLPRADHVTVDAATTIRADALNDGNGGRIAVWSDRHTDYHGFASARGGDSGGNGGFIEVSSKQTLRYRGLTDTRAPNGAWGMTLLDPIDIFIDSPEDEAAIEASLENGNLALDTSPDGEGVGNIAIDVDIDWEAPTTFILDADNDIFINAALNAATGSVAMFALRDVVVDAPVNAPAGDVLINAGGTIQAGTGRGLIIDADTVSFVGGTLRLGSFQTSYDIAATTRLSVDVDTFDLQSGSWDTFETTDTFSANNFQINQFASTFRRTAGGSGTAEDPFQIFDIYGLQGIGTYDGFFVLTDNISGDVTRNWTPFSSTGFQPIENFTGTLDGAGFAVSDVFQDVQIEGPGPVGLFGTIDADATVQNLAIENADFTGSDGGVLATTNEGTVRNVRVSGVLNTQGFQTGGMVGHNSGLIEDSIADVDVNVTAFGSNEIGGFVGENGFGLINRSHALGDVTVINTDLGGNTAVGGFVGQEAGSQVNGFTINDSYARGNVTVTSEVGSEAVVFAGGFVGFMDGTINRSYSTGRVTVNGDPTSFEGGFAGDAGSGASGTGNAWDTDTSGQSSSAFGAPLTTAQFQDTEGFADLARPQGWDFVTTWAPGDDGFYPVNYSTSPVITAVPNDTSVQYGLADTATTTGSVFGGPSAFVFGPSGDTLDTSGLFGNLDVAANAGVGSRSFGLNTASLDSNGGVTYRVVDATGVIEVTPAPLTIIADDDTKTYGETFTPTNFSVSGTLFFDDSVDSVDLFSNGEAADAPVNPGDGGYSIFVGEGGASGSGLDNYDISFVNGTLTINRAPLTISATDQTKTYGSAAPLDGTTDFTITSGTLFFDDDVDTVFITSPAEEDTATVGTYPIAHFDDPLGSGLENYDITLIDGTFDVTPAPLTITANDQSKVYGDALVFDGATDFTVSDGTLFFQDSVDEVSLASDGAPAQAGAGSYAITFSDDPSGNGLENYAITLVPGMLDVSRRALEITATNQGKTYGQTLALDPASGFVITGGTLLFDDSIDTAVRTSAGAAQAAPAGAYSINFTEEVSGTGIENYALFFQPGTLDVNRAPLTITPKNQTKPFGSTFVFTGTEFTTSGFVVEGDGISEVVLSSTGAPADAPAGSYPIVIDEFEGTGIENYDVTEGQGTMTVQGGADSVPRPPVTINVALQNPRDTIDTGTNGSGFSPATGQFGNQNAAETLAKVQSMAEALEIAADACAQNSGDVTRYLACLADALDDFAGELAAISTDLPPGLENVAQIIQTARQQIDGAATRAASRLATATTDAEREAIRREALSEARAALDVASNEIRKAITLVRAEDPELANLQRATITTVANAVDTVGIQLTRVTDL